MSKLFQHRKHKWKLDNLSEWLLLTGLALPKDLWRQEAYRQCTKCGKREPLMKGVWL